MKIATVGLDLAKNVFQLHGVDADGRVVVRRRLRRSEVIKAFTGTPPCLVGMEACAGAHHWARLLTSLGHEVRLMPPAYVKAYVRRQKNDRADAAAICEAVTRPSMRFVPVKSEEQQALLLVHRARDLLVRNSVPQSGRGKAFGFVYSGLDAGSYDFMCKYHPEMTGSMTIS
jgi:transposase